MTTVKIATLSSYAPFMAGWQSTGVSTKDASATLRKMKLAGPHLPVHHDCIGQNYSCTAGSSIYSSPEFGMACIVGNPRWKQVELQEMAWKEGNAVAAARAYAEQGTQFLSSLEGAFAIVIIDQFNRVLLLGTDRFGQVPLYYSVTKQFVLFGTSASAILAHDSIERELDFQGIYNYVYFHMVPSPGSIYRGIRKLQAGQRLLCEKNITSIDRYWLPVFQDENGDHFSTRKDQLRQSLTVAVKRLLPDDKPTGTFLSGGLDSSSVTGILSELSDNPISAFSIGFSAEGYDEIAYARITAKHFGVKLHEYYVTPEDIVEFLPLIAASYDEPFGNSSALPAWFCAKLAAEHGVQRLLAGDGGDEIFAGNERYARQSLFELYYCMPKAIREQVLKPSVMTLAKKFRKFNKVRSYIDQAEIPLPERLQTYNFLHRHSPSEIFSNDFLESVETSQPEALQREVYSAPENASNLHRMLYLDWQFTLADNDLRKVNQMCSLAGIDVAYPMLDDDLVALSCAIPGKRKLKGQNLRAFYKKALEGWLPAATISKNKKGFGLPFGVWTRTHKPLQEMAYDNLLNLKELHYFNSGFIDTAIDLHRNHHAAYYGDLIWILMVFGLWTNAEKFNP